MSKVLQVRQDMRRKFHDFRKSHRQATCHFGPAIDDSMGDEQVVLSAELHSECYSTYKYSQLWNVYAPIESRMGPSSPHLNRAPPQDHCQETHMQANNFHGFHPCRTVSHRKNISRGFNLFMSMLPSSVLHTGKNSNGIFEFSCTLNS